MILHLETIQSQVSLYEDLVFLLRVEVGSAEHNFQFG
jgi:hypothetical protein